MPKSFQGGFFISVIRSKIITAALALALPASALAHHVDGHVKGDIKAESAYSRAMLPVAKVGGGYLTIINSGAADRLVSASSEPAGDVQNHEMKMDGGVMEMRELKDGVAVPAHGPVELKPGSYHLMFMQVDKPFKEGETVKATLPSKRPGQSMSNCPSVQWLVAQSLRLRMVDTAIMAAMKDMANNTQSVHAGRHDDFGDLCVRPDRHPCFHLQG